MRMQDEGRLSSKFVTYMEGTDVFVETICLCMLAS